MVCFVDKIFWRRRDLGDTFFYQKQYPVVHLSTLYSHNGERIFKNVIFVIMVLAPLTGSVR